MYMAKLAKYIFGSGASWDERSLSSLARRRHLRKRKGAYFPGQLVGRRKRNSGIMKHNERRRTRSAIPMEEQRHAECMYATTMIWFRPTKTHSDIPRDWSWRLDWPWGQSCIKRVAGIVSAPQFNLNRSCSHIRDANRPTWRPWWVTPRLVN